MKQTLFFLPLLLFFLCSCEKEETESTPEAEFSAIVTPGSLSVQEPLEIPVTITTPTPCYSIEVVKTVSGNTFDYDFILTQVGEMCVQVVKEHDLTVVFDPPATGTYTIRFLIDGELYETREIVVSEYSLVGTWQVLRFEDEAGNIVISSPEGEEIVIAFDSSGFHGTTERNEFQGEYQVQAENKIFITEYVTTEANETKFGKMFYDAITMGQMQQLPFEVNEDLLKINYEEGAYMVLSRQ